MRQIFWCVALGVMLSPAAAAAADPPERTVRVRGEGKASAPPDMATIRTGVVTQDAEARKALSANNKAMEKVMTTLQQFGIEKKDVQTSGFSVRPVHRRDNGRVVPEITGYRVSNQLSVQVRDLKKLGEVLDALVESGSNQLSGVSFGLQDRQALLAEARREAMADARRRAELYAREASARLGEVRTISEQALPVQPVSRQFAFEAASARASVPVAPGELDVRASVHVVYTLTDARD
jgi:uncharacterized protein YggE